MTHPPLATDLASLFDQHAIVHLAFSGGKESVALANMLLPWRDRVTLLWTNTGDAPDEHAAFVRSFGNVFRLVELQSDVRASWRQFGPPAKVLTVEHMRDLGCAPRWQPWTLCCWRTRHQPMVGALQGVATELAKRGLTTTFVHGQRDQDRAFSAAQAVTLFPGMASHFPLWDWTRADVDAYLAANGLELSPTYAMTDGSVECIGCPVELSPGKLAWLDRHHPAVGREVRETALAQLADAEAMLARARADLGAE